MALLNLNCEIHTDLVEDGRCICFMKPVEITPAPSVTAKPKRMSFSELRELKKRRDAEFDERLKRDGYVALVDDNRGNCYYIPSTIEPEFKTWVSTRQEFKKDHEHDFDDYWTDPKGAFAIAFLTPRSSMN